MSVFLPPPLCGGAKEPKTGPKTPKVGLQAATQSEIMLANGQHISNKIYLENNSKQKKGYRIIRKNLSEESQLIRLGDYQHLYILPHDMRIIGRVSEKGESLY